MVIIDGIVDLPTTRKSMPDRGDEFFVKPASVAETVYQLSRQEPSAWTFELEARLLAKHGNCWRSSYLQGTSAVCGIADVHFADLGN